jgi:hypothetical protein
MSAPEILEAPPASERCEEALERIRVLARAMMGWDEERLAFTPTDRVVLAEILVSLTRDAEE